MVRQKKLNRIKILLCTIVLFCGCANQLPPGGGGPDLEPPTVVDVYPPDKTLNYTGDFFEVTFSEYIEKRSFRDAIFISPAIEGELKVSWTGRTATVEFFEPLKQNVTYNITLGTDIEDYNNRNKMASAFNFSFSTGERIDSGIIAGKVFGEKSAGSMIFAYLLDGDTINPGKLKPDYISQAGKEGRFTLVGLTPGDYLVFAVQDQFRDLLFQSEQDEIAVPDRVIKVNQHTDTTNIPFVNFYLQKIDTIAPRILNAVMTDERHIIVSFSEEIENGGFNNHSVSVLNIANKSVFHPNTFFRGKTKPSEFVLLIPPVSDSSEFKVIIDSLKDKSGNITVSDTTNLIISSTPDTTAPNLFRVIPTYNYRECEFENAVFSFSFDDAIKTEKLKSALIFTDTLKNRVDFEIETTEPSQFVVKPLKNLKPSTDYIIQFNFKDVPDFNGNSNDSLYTYRFRTISELEYSGVYGKLITNDSTLNYKIVLENISTPGKYIYGRLSRDGAFEFPKLRGGKYHLICFIDNNGNGELDKGYPFPYVRSEEFYYFHNILDVSPRWAITEVEFELPGKMPEDR